MYRISFFIALIFEENQSNKKTREATGFNYKGFSFKKGLCLMSFSSIFIITESVPECLKKSEMSHYEILKMLLYSFLKCSERPRSWLFRAASA